MTVRTFAAAAGFALLVLLAVSVACGGGGGPAIDIKDFDTARFTMTQTSTSSGDTSQLTGEGVIDNRQQALSVTYQGGPGGEDIAIGRTTYSYDEGEQRWVSYTEPVDGQVGFGRPYWPQFWRDAVDVVPLEEINPEGQEDSAITGYRLTFDREKVAKRLEATETSEPQPLDVRQAEVEVWVDKDTRYAVQLTFRLEVAFGESSTNLEITSTFSDYGTEVQIEAPAEVATPTPAQG
jgi:hypothetical protein